MGFGATPANTFGSSLSRTTPRWQEVTSLMQKVRFLKQNQEFMQTQPEQAQQQNVEILRLFSKMQRLLRTKQRNHVKNETFLRI